MIKHNTMYESVYKFTYNEQWIKKKTEFFYSKIINLKIGNIFFYNSINKYI